MRRHNANQNTVSVFIFFSKSAAPHTLLVNKLLIRSKVVKKAALNLFKNKLKIYFHKEKLKRSK